MPSGLRVSQCFAAVLLFVAGQALADLSIPMHKVDENGVGAPVGTVSVTTSPHGVVLTPDLKGLAPGMHGFHVHQNPSCDAAEQNGKKVAALAAGGHYDPHNSGKHGTPWGDGHLGDLPPLYVTPEGDANAPVLAPRLKLADVRDRALMVHAGGDNHADHPAPLGGGGARVACGVIGN